tara:strand:- start:116 stop:352 length:237 start_codon:yes stop_codon:yes gene_type:complete
MELLKKFALIIHWVGFVCAIFLGLLFIGFALVPEFSDQRVLMFSLGIFACLACSVLGWLARFVLVGKVHFLPWRVLNH